jgi:hypothetical protein
MIHRCHEAIRLYAQQILNPLSYVCLLNDSHTLSAGPRNSSLGRPIAYWQDTPRRMELQVHQATRSNEHDHVELSVQHRSHTSVHLVTLYTIYNSAISCSQNIIYTWRQLPPDRYSLTPVLLLGSLAFLRDDEEGRGCRFACADESTILRRLSSRPEEGTSPLLG